MDNDTRQSHDSSRQSHDSSNNQLSHMRWILNTSDGSKSIEINNQMAETCGTLLSSAEDCPDTNIISANLPMCTSLDEIEFFIQYLDAILKDDKVKIHTFATLCFTEDAHRLSSLLFIAEYLECRILLENDILLTTSSNFIRKSDKNSRQLYFKVMFETDKAELSHQRSIDEKFSPLHTAFNHIISN